MKKKKSKLSKKAVARHIVRFERGSQECDATMLAMIGVCNREISRRTGLTDSQVTYRLHKAKVLGSHDHGFRHQWRYGNSGLVDKVLHDYQGVIALEIERTIAIRLDHPSPDTVSYES